MYSLVFAKPAKVALDSGIFEPSTILDAASIKVAASGRLEGKRTDSDTINYQANFLAIPNCKIIVTDRDIFYLDDNDRFFPAYYPKPWVYKENVRPDGSLAIDCSGLAEYRVLETAYAPFVVAGNWFHTLIDNYSRMYYFDQLKSPALKVVIPFWAAKGPASSLNDRHLVNSIFMEGKQVEFLKKGVYRFDRIILPPLGNQDDYIFTKPLQFVAQTLSALLPSWPVTHKMRLFISRADIKLRNLSNEQDLVAALKPFGIMPICPGDFSFRTQLEIFSAAELILGVHGQGFVPMIAAHQCRRILEFEAANWNFTAYRSIASCLGIPYEKLPCNLIEQRNPGRFDWLAAANISECLAQVEKAINEL